MDLNRFKDCCAAFGAQRRRWPEAEQALHDQFAGTAEGATILAQAERTDRFLDALSPVPPAPQLLQRIAGLSRPARRGFGMPWAAGLACSVCLLVGFVLGFVQAQGLADRLDAADWLLGPQSLQDLAP